MNNKSDSIIDMIDKGYVVDSLQILEKEIEKIGDFSLLSRLQNIKTMLGFMMKYLQDGTPDPGRVRMYRELKSNLVDIETDYLRSRDMKESPALYFSTARMMDYSKVTLENIIDKYRKTGSLYSIMAESETADSAIMTEREKSLKEIFEWIWTSRQLNDSQMNLLVKMTNDSEEDFGVKCMIIAGLMLSLLHGFNTSKFKTLLKIYDSTEDERIAARSMVSIVFVLAKYGDVTVWNPTIYDQLEMWGDSILTYSRMRDVCMSIMTSFDTKRVNRDFMERLMPDMKKFSPQLKKMMEDLPATDPEDLAESIESNPQWEKFMKESGLEDKMREMSEMVSQGSDIMYSSFKTSKNFPFFREVNNWFMPFEKYHTGFSAASANMIDGLSMSDNTKTICDSDKYSIGFTFDKLPAAVSNQMSSQMSEFMKQNNSDLSEKLNAVDARFSAECRGFVKDCYRFFTLFSRSAEFYNPFEKPIMPNKLPVIGESLFDDDFKRVLSEFLVRNGYYGLALSYLESILDAENDPAATYQKIGYCHHKLNHYIEALSNYRKAELFDADSQWLKTVIGEVCYRLGYFSEAAESFEKALKSDPDNLPLIRKAAEANLAIGKADAALAYFYKLEYLHPDADSVRGIAWGEFLRGNSEKSLKYFEKILGQSENVGAIDYIRAGHVILASGIRPENEAFAMYREGACKGGKDFRKLACADWKILEDMGVDRDNFNFMIDTAKL